MLSPMLLSSRAATIGDDVNIGTGIRASATAF